MARGHTKGKRRSVTKPTLISLFTGAGGLDIGLELAGFTTLFANDSEAYCCETLRANQLLGKMKPSQFDAWFKRQLEQRCYRSTPKEKIAALKKRLKKGVGKSPYLRDAVVVQGDVKEIAAEKVSRVSGLRTGEAALIAGGPPCQSFSRSGTRGAVDEKRGQLFVDFVRVVDVLRPRWFLFENVKGLILTKADILFVHCQHCGSATIPPFDGRLKWIANEKHRLACPECGSAHTRCEMERQRRASLDMILSEFERIGYVCYWRILNAADFGAPQVRERLFVVGSRDNERFEWPIETHCANGDGQLSLLAEKEPWNTMHATLWSNGHPEFGALDLDEAVLWVKNLVRPHDEPVTWRLDRPSPTIGAHQGAKLAVAPEGVPEEQLKRQQWHVLGKRQGDSPPVPVRHAYLSDTELLTLQTYPSHWYFYGTRMQRASQIGNAVPAVFGKAIGSAILQASRGKKASLPQTRVV